MEKNEVAVQWMVLSRHFGMPGGLFDYGEATIEEFFDSFEDAVKYAENLFLTTHEGLVDPRVWVLKCERTYVRSKEGPAYVFSKTA